MFTEDGDNPYYKQASPGITDYFPSVQDKQKKNNPKKFQKFRDHANCQIANVDDKYSCFTLLSN